MNNTTKKIVVASVAGIVGITLLTVALTFPTIPVGIAIGWAFTKYWNAIKTQTVDVFNRFWN